MAVAAWALSELLPSSITEQVVIARVVARKQGLVIREWWVASVAVVTTEALDAAEVAVAAKDLLATLSLMSTEVAATLGTKATNAPLAAILMVVASDAMAENALSA